MAKKVLSPVGERAALHDESRSFRAWSPPSARSGTLSCMQYAPDPREAGGEGGGGTWSNGRREELDPRARISMWELEAESALVVAASSRMQRRAHSDRSASPRP